MINNDALPRVEVDSETYEVRADGRIAYLRTCQHTADGATLFPFLSERAYENFSRSTGDCCGCVARRVRPGLARKEADTLLLTWEQRRWMRGRFVTESGREIGMALPTGTQVESGQTLWIGTDWYLTMKAANEPLLVIDRS